MIVSTIIFLTVTSSFRTVMSNEGTPIYQLTKNLTKVLSPLTKSECTVDSATSFNYKMKNVKVPINHILALFDVKYLFTNVPLDRTIDFIF